MENRNHKYEKIYNIINSVNDDVYIGSTWAADYGILYAFNGKKFENPVIVKPKLGKTYIFDHEMWSTINGDTRCLGKITIEVFHPDPANVSRIEFWVDGAKQCELTSPPYIWTWTNRTKISHFRFAHSITVVAVNRTGMKKYAGISLWRFF